MKRDEDRPAWPQDPADLAECPAQLAVLEVNDRVAAAGRPPSPQPVRPSQHPEQHRQHRHRTPPRLRRPVARPAQRTTARRQSPQPRVHSPQPGSIIRHALTRHALQAPTAAATRQIDARQTPPRPGSRPPAIRPAVNGHQATYALPRGTGRRRNPEPDRRGRRERLRRWISAPTPTHG